MGALRILLKFAPSLEHPNAITSTLESELDVHHESFTVLKYIFQETGT
jgi:hypothetical protein